MALNGFRTSEDKRSRLISTAFGLVVATRRANQPQVYDIYRDGMRIGEVRKFGSWYASPTDLNALNSGRLGLEESHKTRHAAVEELLRAIECCCVQTTYTRKGKERKGEMEDGKKPNNNFGGEDFYQMASTDGGFECNGGACDRRETCAHTARYAQTLHRIYPVPAGAFCGYYEPKQQEGVIVAQDQNSAAEVRAAMPNTATPLSDMTAFEKKAEQVSRLLRTALKSDLNVSDPTTFGLVCHYAIGVLWDDTVEKAHTDPRKWNLYYTRKDLSVMRYLPGYNKTE